MAPDEQLTVIVRRRVRRGSEAAFEAVMQEFIRFALAFPGNLGINVLRPDASSPGVYTVVNRFADSAVRQQFKGSARYQEWMQRLAELTDGDPQIEEIGGLGGWFTPPGVPRALVPSRLRMACVTFLGVYPLTAMLPGAYKQVLPSWHPLLLNVVVTGSIVALLTWAVMPLLTRLFARWLFKSAS